MPAEARAGSKQVTDDRKGRTHEWRVGMVGAITLYDKAGARLGTIYAATAPPEDKKQGKTAFWNTVDRKVEAATPLPPAPA